MLDLSPTTSSKILAELAESPLWDQVMATLSDGTKESLFNGPRRPTGQRMPDSGSKRTGSDFILDQNFTQEAIWGDKQQILWARGEPFYIVSSPGIGKTTIAQQLLLRRVGMRTGEFLDLPVEVDPGKVLYIAADRPRQAARSMRRMVKEEDRAALESALVIWAGAPPFSISAEPEQFVPWIRALDPEIGTVFIDSLLDVAFDISEETGGSRTNAALQSLVRDGIEVLVIHHDRKRGEADRSPKQDDMYGSRALSKGAGSIAYLTGDPGEAHIRLLHLKRPANDCGPLQLVHLFNEGLTEIDKGQSAWAPVF